jgi:Fe-S-cluster containining protein
MPTPKQVQEQHETLTEIAGEILAAWGSSPAHEPLEDVRAAVDDIYVQARDGAARDGTPFSCRGIGCNACCRGEVAVMQRELERIVPLVSDDAFRRAVNNPDLLHPKRARFAMCPLLDPKTGGCSVYAERPIVCRTYHVVTPAEWCDPAGGTRDVASSALVSAAVVAVHVAHETQHGSGYVVTLGEAIVAEARRRGFTEGR